MPCSVFQIGTLSHGIARCVNQKQEFMGCRMSGTCGSRAGSETSGLATSSNFSCGFKAACSLIRRYSVSKVVSLVARS